MLPFVRHNGRYRHSLLPHGFGVKLEKGIQKEIGSVLHLPTALCARWTLPYLSFVMAFQKKIVHYRKYLMKSQDFLSNINNFETITESDCLPHGRFHTILRG